MHEIDSSVKVPSEIPSAIVGALPLFDWLGNKVMGMPRQLTKEMVEEFHGNYPRVSSAKIERELGWQPIDFKQSLSDTMDWIRKVFINKN
jgi:nucleoside-diphosphate-sugar epimerase